MNANVPLPPTQDFLPDPSASASAAPETVPGAAGPAEPAGTQDYRGEPWEEGDRWRNGAAPAASAAVPAIPGYRIEREIARGGMGRVWAGLDLELDREVAIKTLLPGADAERFVTEAKITARLPHPGIPPVHRLGHLADGSCFLAMKLIRGRTLAELLKERTSPQADQPRFVQIFEQIAQAVGFAHSQGVLHRDLKPLNVMVGAFGEVQVMDWGLAKAHGLKEAESEGIAVASMPRSTLGAPSTDLTAAGAVMGTPGFMAPEQARAERLDARADVFALGSILAAILTKKPAVTGSSVSEIVQATAKGELTDAFARLDRCGAEAELVALAKSCLAPKAGDRPADGQAVARQVAAYRAGVEARLKQAETAKAQALVREAEQRKRRQVWIGLAATLLVGLVATAALAWRALYAERQASLNEKQAKDNLAFAKKGNEILGSVFAGLDPRLNYANVGTFVKAMRDNLSKAALELEGSAIGDPLEVAAMQRTLGASFLALGAPEQARALFEKSRTTRTDKLGPDHPETLNSANDVAVSYASLNRHEEALKLNEEVLELRKAKLGPDHPDTLTSMHNLANSYANLGRQAKALKLIQETLDLRTSKLGLDHPDTLHSMHNLANSHAALGQHAEALELRMATLALMKRKHGPDHPDTLTIMHNLANSHAALGQHAEALKLREETLALKQTKLGPDHPETLRTMMGLANSQAAFGQHAQAQATNMQLIAALEARLAKNPNEGDMAVTLAGVCCNLGRSIHDTGKPDAAIPWFGKGQACLESLLSKEPNDAKARLFLRNIHWNRVRSHEQLRQFAEADADWAKAIDLSPVQEKAEVKKERAEWLAKRPPGTSPAARSTQITPPSNATQSPTKARP